MPKIELRKLSKVFRSNKGQVIALDNVNLVINHGEFFSLFGPSGSGKTTLLRIIAGLEKPTSGEVWIDNELVTSSEKGVIVPPAERRVGVVFQNWGLYPHMTIFDNIALPLKIKHVPKNEIRNAVRHIAEVLEINDILNRYPNQLSSGQQQRVALARALISNPHILLIDEPFTNLDIKLRTIARILVKNIQRQFNITTVLVSHDPDDVLNLADRTAMLIKGRIIQVDEPAKVYDEPQSIDVANAIGNLNIIKATILNYCNHESTTVYLGIRPRDIILSSSHHVDENYVKIGIGVVKAIEIQDNEPLMVIDINGYYIKAAFNQLYRVGDGVVVLAKKNKVLVFKLNNGELDKSHDNCGFAVVNI